MRKFITPFILGSLMGMDVVCLLCKESGGSLNLAYHFGVIASRQGRFLFVNW